MDMIKKYNLPELNPLSSFNKGTESKELLQYPFKSAEITDDSNEIDGSMISNINYWNSLNENDSSTLKSEILSIATPPEIFGIGANRNVYEF